MAKTLQEQRMAFTPPAEQIIARAQQEASAMQASEYRPEHLLLSILKQKDEDSESVFSLLGLDFRALRRVATDVVYNAVPAHATRQYLPPSKEAQECLDWAVSFAEQRHSAALKVEHIILAVLRHAQVQPLLLLLFTPGSITPSYLTEESGMAYTSAMDQLIQIKICEHKRLQKSIATSPMLKYERPTMTFADILGADAAKQALRPLISYLRRPQASQSSVSNFLEETLLIGHPYTERTLLVHAVAGESVLALATLSLVKLVDLINELRLGTVDSENLAWLKQEYPLFNKDDVQQTARNMIHSSFQVAQDWAPCLLFLDDLDAIMLLRQPEDQKAVQRQLLVELDGLGWQPPLTIIAAVHKLNMLDPHLLDSSHFGRRVILSESYAVHPAAQIKICLSCKHEVLATWRHCVYCGASLLKACPSCGAPHVEIEGARYCFSCGSDNWA